MKYFTLNEMRRSYTAAANGIANVPNDEQMTNMIALVEKVLDPAREAFGKPIKVTSGFRCARLNELVGGAKSSQHLCGEAADISAECKADNAKLFRWIRDNLVYDQLIWEGGNEQFPAWIHVSYKRQGENRKQYFKV